MIKTSYICDKCGKEVESTNLLFVRTKGTLSVIGRTSDRNMCDYECEMCLDCYRDFIEYSKAFFSKENE